MQWCCMCLDGGDLVHLPCKWLDYMKLEKIILYNVFAIYRVFLFKSNDTVPVISKLLFEVVIWNALFVSSSIA